MNSSAGEQAELIQQLLLKHAEATYSQDSIDLANLIDACIQSPDNIGAWEEFYLSLKATADINQEEIFFQELLEKAGSIELEV